MTMQREALPRRVESSSAAAPGLVGRAAVAPAFAASLAEFGGASRLVETVTAGRRRTAIRVGRAGLAEGFRELAAVCHK